MYFFSAYCIQPLIITALIPSKPNLGECSPYCVIRPAVVGHCTTIKGDIFQCPVKTKMLLQIQTWRDFVGPIYLTCAKNGWFPYLPIVDNYRLGKYSIRKNTH